MNSRRLFASSGPFLRVPVSLVDEERAELGVARVIVGEEERRRGRVDAERARGVDQRADVIVVPRLLEPDRGLDRGNSDDAIGIAVDEHENVAGVGARRGSRERCERAHDPLRQPLAIRRQRREAGAGALGQREHRREVVPARSAGRGTRRRRRRGSATSARD